MDTRLRRGSSFWKAFVSVAWLTFFPMPPCFVESKTDVRLDYICTEPVPVPEGESEVPVIMLHGILEVKEMWDGIYQKVSYMTKRKTCIYDTRNHGGSSWNDTCTVDATVEDLESFMDMMKINRAVLVGHSLGGLTVMKFAVSNPSRVESIFVEDSAPVPGALMEAAVGYAIRVLQRSLSAVPDNADERTAKTEIWNYMRKYIPGNVLPSYKKFMPVHRRNGVWQWKTNLKAINKAMYDIPSAYTTMEGRYEGKALFIYAKHSAFGVDNQKEEIRKLFPNVKFVSVDTNDHFLHVVYPDYTKVLLDFLK